MLKIRRDIFETNSSSMHSISVRRRKVKEIRELKPVDGKIIIESINDLEFDFDEEPCLVLDTPYEKMCYAIASYSSYGIKDIEKALSEIFSEECKIILPEESDREDGRIYTGYVDMCIFELDEFLKHNNISLEDFIMDPELVVLLDDADFDRFKSYNDWGIDNGKFLNVDYVPRTSIYEM